MEEQNSSKESVENRNWFRCFRCLKLFIIGHSILDKPNGEGVYYCDNCFKEAWKKQDEYLVWNKNQKI